MEKDNKSSSSHSSEYHEILKKLNELNSVNKNEVKWDLEKIVKIVGTVLLIPTIILSYYSYQQAEKWKEAEFAGTEFRSFINDPEIKIVNSILDYNRIQIKLFKEKDSLYAINDGILEDALLVDTIRGEFTPVEKRIRDLFDNYFDRLSIFEGDIESNLIDTKQTEIYLGYYIKIIADKNNKRKENGTRQILWRYINNYFPAAQKLCARFVTCSINAIQYKRTEVSKDTLPD